MKPCGGAERSGARLGHESETGLGFLASDSRYRDPWDAVCERWIYIVYINGSPVFVFPSLYSVIKQTFTSNTSPAFTIQSTFNNYLSHNVPSYNTPPAHSGQDQPPDSCDWIGSDGHCRGIWCRWVSWTTSLEDINSYNSSSSNPQNRRGASCRARPSMGTRCHQLGHL